eukprot:TRINITY_DN1797_c0_g2_i4.p1 TRINITY_DN1797_c0_g2~~TRINITY_DN1797_c0_g2_i4.p1  ORF type:complete len:126 (-),score=9.43 TRINITY_DN1797_c0_g2_i4:10-387(-)
MRPWGDEPANRDSVSGPEWVKVVGSSSYCAGPVVAGGCPWKAPHLRWWCRAQGEGRVLCQLMDRCRAADDGRWGFPAARRPFATSGRLRLRLRSDAAAPAPGVFDSRTCRRAAARTVPMTCCALE